MAVDVVCGLLPYPDEEATLNGELYGLNNEVINWHSPQQLRDFGVVPDAMVFSYLRCREPFPLTRIQMAGRAINPRSLDVGWLWLVAP